MYILFITFISYEGVCVFTDKKYIRRASYVLVPLIAINTFVGCAVVNKNTIKSEDYTDNKIGIEIIEDYDYSQDILEETVVTTEADVSESVVKNGAFAVLSNLLEESGKDTENILSVSDRNSDLYASALYAKAKSYSLSDEVILSELENIICFGTQATCVDEVTWYELFGNLLGTISEYENVVDYYYPLAAYVHKYSCALEHSSIFFDENRIVCDEIERMYEEKNPSIDYVSYVKDMILASEDESLIDKFYRIVNSGTDVESAFYELDSIYYFSASATDLSEELSNQLFSNLISTLQPNENVYSIYYDLAYYIHSLFCDLEHTINQEGMYECVDDLFTLKK